MTNQYMINKYIKENEYGFDRYKEIAIQNHKIQLPDCFSQKEKEDISIFIGYTLAYVIHLNNKILITKQKQASKNRSREAKRLLEALAAKKINHISFNLNDKTELLNKSEALIIKDSQTINEILQSIIPALNKQIGLEEDKINVKIGTKRNSFRKDILISLTPLMRYLMHETAFSEKSWEYIAKWILDFLNPKIIMNYPDLQLNNDSYSALIRYEYDNREKEYSMIRV